MLTLIFAALLLPPVPAARIAARALDVPEDALVAIVRRESAGQRVGIHAGDAWTSKPACIKAKRVGWLHDGADCDAGGWGTRGCAGLLAAYQLRWLGLDRFPWLLDIPIVSAVAAARKLEAVCPERRWCP